MSENQLSQQLALILNVIEGQSALIKNLADRVDRLEGDNNLVNSKPEQRSYKVGLRGESNYQYEIKRLKPGDEVFLDHDRLNEHDDRAIVVASRAGMKLGYLPRGGWLTDAIIDEDKEVSAKVLSIDRSSGGSLGVVIEVTW